MFDSRRAPVRLLPPIKKIVTGLLLLSLAACASLGASGPQGSAVRSAAKESVGAANIQVVPVTEAVARRVLASFQTELFSQTLGEVPPEGTIIGPGDVLEITVWEAPPAVLFGATAVLGTTTGQLAPASVAQQNTIPEMMVNTAGIIRVPFAGDILAAGKTPQQLEQEIARRLAGKAHDPQVAVRISRNANATVTLVGDVANNSQVPLTARGERLLDVLATAGGVKTPIDKTTIQITRNGKVVSLPLATVIRDPAQNVRLQAQDVVTAISQSFSFTSLGETGTSAEIPFESTGITLAQALGRVGGLKSDRADIHGVFIFRLENPTAVDPTIEATAQRTPDGRIPIVYVVDLKNPASFFIAQGFPIRDKDVLYVSAAPLSDLQRFVGMVASMVFPIINVSRVVP